jgi:hypothetical protein
MDIFNLDKLYLFLIFFIPGFVSTKIWGLIVPSENRKPSDYLLETVSYSCINFALLSWLIIIVNNPKFQSSNQALIYVIWFLILFAFPAIWPIIFHWILSLKCFKGVIVHPIPKAWDFFFGTGDNCYVLVHLKSGKLIGGLYGFASSYPNSEDIYLKEVWEVSDDGKFLSKIENTKGLWVGKDFFDYLEFFEVMRMEEKEND